MAIRTPLFVAGAAIISSLLTYSLTHERMSTEEPDTMPKVSESNGKMPSEKYVLISQGGCAEKSVLDNNINDSSVSPDKQGESLVKSEGIDEAVANSMKRRQKIRKSILSFISSERKKGTSNISAVVERRFYQEEVDEKWASGKEKSISDRFENDKDLKGLYPLEVTCRSENCKVVLPIESQDRISSISNSLSGVKIDSTGEGSMVYSFPDDVTNRLIVYVSKENGMDMIK